MVNIAKEYTEQLTSARIVELLEAYNSYHGLYFYLGSRIAFSEDPEEHYKYIEAAARTGGWHRCSVLAGGGGCLHAQGCCVCALAECWGVRWGLCFRCCCVLRKLIAVAFAMHRQVLTTS